MKRILSLLLLLSLLSLLPGCGKKETADLVFISVEDRTDGPVYADCVACTERICSDRGLTMVRLEAGDTAVAVAEAVEKAYGMGASVTVIYGREADGSVIEHDGMKQLYVSASTDGSGLASVGCLCFDMLSCAYLTGYAVAASGYNQIGFIGDTDRTSVELGFGLVQGYCRGSADSGAPEGSRILRYWYAGDESEVQLESVYWYGLGTQIIFTSGDDLRQTVASSQPEAPCFDLNLASGCFSGVFVKALETALDGGNFSVYTDTSWARRPQAMPECLSRLCSCSDRYYSESFRSLLSFLRPGLLDFSDADGLGDPSGCVYGDSVELVFFG